MFDNLMLFHQGIFSPPWMWSPLLFLLEDLWDYSHLQLHVYVATDTCVDLKGPTVINTIHGNSDFESSMK